MKQLAILLVMLTTVSMAAQRHDGPKMRKGPKMDMTAEQMATLQTKHMTLALDLTEDQLNQIYKINLEKAQFGKEKWQRRKRQERVVNGKKPLPKKDLKWKTHVWTVKSQCRKK